MTERMYTQALSALGRESGSANSGSEDEVSRPDYAAMMLKEKEGPGSVRFGSVRFTTPLASRNIESISIRQIPSSSNLRPGSASLTVTLGDEIARVCKSLKQNPKRSLEVGGTSARSRSLVHDRGHALLAAFAGEAAVATWIAIVKTTLRIQ